MRIEEIKEQCTGCGACASVCPIKCITMTADEEGFYYPQINSSFCVQCHKCEKVCHCLQEKTLDNQVHDSFYGFSKDTDIRRNSSSGGAFTHLAQNILDQNGVVYGAAFDYEDLKLAHFSTDQVTLEQLRKSKYVESYMGLTAQKVQDHIKAGQKVLFCGTPCQVDGVKRAVEDPHNLLVTCDFICHGVPSAILFKEHIKSIIKKEKLISIDFRPEEYGWIGKALKISTIEKIRLIPFHIDSFYYGFLTSNALLRQCCYQCKYRITHSSDITIADFWGYKDLDPQLNDEKGISLLIANTEVGRNLIMSMDNFHLVPLENHYSDYIYSPRDYSEAYKLRKQFFEIYFKTGFEKAASKTYMHGIWKQKTKYYIKKFLGRAI